PPLQQRIGRHGRAVDQEDRARAWAWARAGDLPRPRPGGGGRRFVAANQGLTANVPARSSPRSSPTRAGRQGRAVSRAEGRGGGGPPHPPPPGPGASVGPGAPPGPRRIAAMTVPAGSAGVDGTLRREAVASRRQRMSVNVPPVSTAMTMGWWAVASGFDMLGP